MTARAQPLRILLLCDDRRDHASAVLKHIAAFTRLSRHRIHTFNPRGTSSSRCLDLDEFDAVVVHYSLVITVDHYLAPDFREQLRRFRGLKVQFIQDDYRWVDRIAAMMRHLGIGVLYTLVPEPEIPKIWSEDRLPGVLKLTTLAGYVPEEFALLQVPPLAERRIDVGYRGRILPYWLGRLGQDKVAIGKGFLERAHRYGLRSDIAWSEGDRLYGADWARFLSSCRAMLGSESGASITDFDGSVERGVQRYLSRHPEADFEQVFGAVLEPYEGNVRMNVVSPRVFEAAALRTPMILFPGEYSGVVESWRHFVPLEKDFSNMDQVVDRLRDTEFLEELAERTYDDVVASGRYSYEMLVAGFDDVVSENAAPTSQGFLFRYRFALGERRLRGLRFSRRIQVSRPKPSTEARLGLVLGLTVRDFRVLLLAYLRSRRARRSVALTPLLRDVLRLAVLRNAQRGRVTAGDHFRVVAQFEADRETLRVTSRRMHPGEEGTYAGAGAFSTASDWRAALSGGKAGSIVWTHSALGRRLPYATRRWRWHMIDVGDRGEYRFEALRHLAADLPDEVATAVVSAVEPPPPRGVRVLQLGLRHPLLYCFLAIRLARHTLLAPGLRRVVLGYLGDREIRKAVGSRRALGDLLRVCTLRESVGVHFHVLWEYRPEDECLLLRSVSAAGPETDGRAAAPRLPLRTVVWDHSGVGHTSLCVIGRRRTLDLRIGKAGVYEFTALSEIAARRSTDVWLALHPLLTSPVPDLRTGSDPVPEVAAWRRS